jgi:periplasmic divalent cation tolerance protein
MSGRACVVLVTAPSGEVAATLARTVVEERLAACGNILPGVTSIFAWQGSMERAGEVLVLLKTTQRLLPALTERVAELHPYDVPEILALPALGGLDAYLEWVEASTGPHSEEEEAD